MPDPVGDTPPVTPGVSLATKPTARYHRHLPNTDLSLGQTPTTTQKEDQ